MTVWDESVYGRCGSGGLDDYEEVYYFGTDSLLQDSDVVVNYL